MPDLDGPNVKNDRLGYITRDRHQNKWVVFSNHDCLRSIFGDNTYGGPGAALRAAISYRDDIYPILPQHNIDQEHLNSVLSGIYYVDLDDGKSDRFCAQWKVDGRRHNRQRSIAKHGREEALRQVCLLRYEAKEKDTPVGWPEFWQAAKDRYL